MEELERKTEEEIIQKKELRRKIKEKLFFTTEKYRKEADRKITESVLELKERLKSFLMRQEQLYLIQLKSVLIRILLTGVRLRILLKMT